MKKYAVIIPALMMMASVLWAADAEVAGKCMTCHKEKSPGIYKQWYQSQHGLHKVTCIDCHDAGKEDVDAFMHEGTLISTLVTPRDCGKCHQKEMQEVENSYHATAGLILESNDAYMAHITAGQPIAITGCENCHGAKMLIDNSQTNKLSQKCWPNAGIGRLNPDGSKGSCNACHTRHLFSKAQARQPEACSKCHLGPDHPQKEIYEESKHGNSYYTNISKMNLESDSWVVGEDYYLAPTCATCHMSATQNQLFTHDVGERISWTLRPPVSQKKDNWETKRANMKDVCRNCHSSDWVNGHYYQFDASVGLYDEKFAKPAGRIMKIVQDKKLMEHPAAFSNDIEWTYWELWHHEGRRTRHGASMMGPDYTWWHGMYEVAKHFYFGLLPEARAYNDPEVNAYIDSLMANDPMHAWLNQNTDKLKEEIRSGKMQEIYKKFFEEK